MVIFLVFLFVFLSCTYVNSAILYAIRKDIRQILINVLSVYSVSIMKVEVNKAMFQGSSLFDSGTGWLLKFGHIYRFDNMYSDAKLHAACIRRAIEQGNIVVKGISARYYAPRGTLFYYPFGSFKCTICCSGKGDKRVTMSHRHPIHFAPSTDENGYYSVLVCSKCIEEDKETSAKLLSRVYTEFRFRNVDDIDDLRQQALERAKKNAEKRALFCIKPYLIHWAFKYQGPCYRLLQSRYPTL